MPERIGLQAVMDDAQWRAGISNYITSVDTATKTTTQGAQQITQSTQNIGQAWQTVGTLVGGIITSYMVKQVADAAFQLGELGATAIRQRTAFEELARQAGGSSDEILAALKRATDGTVAQTDIILAANRGILLGLGAQADQWEKLAEVARFRARAMGLSVTQALADITTGIGRQSRLILDNLGIILDTEQVYAEYAASIGTTADALDDAGKKQALMTAVIQEGQEQIAAAGGITADYADQIERMDATLKDLKTTLAEAVAPAVADVAGAVADTAPTIADTANKLATLVEAGLAWVGAAISGKDATEAFNDSLRQSVGVLDDLNAAAATYEQRRGAITSQIREADAATSQYEDRLRGLQTDEANLAAAEESRFKQRAALVAEQRKAEEQAAKDLAKEAEKAEEDRIRAQEKALREMQQNEQQYANALGQLYDQIVSAQQQAQQERLQADRDYAADVLKLEQDLARERADIQRDLARDLSDMRREYRQDQEDAERDLARDLEDLNSDLAERNADTWADYYAELESLAERHGQRMQAIEEKYADLRAGIDEKYRTEKTQEELRDEEVEALKKQLEEMRALQEAGLTGIDYTQAINDILAQLDALKQEELAALEAKQAEEAAAEEAAYQQEQEKAAQRREEQLAANQAWYDQEAAQRQTAYERQLEDLRIAYERERAERQLAAARAMDDLRARGDQERAELAAQHQARLAEIERGLQADTAAFRDAYNNQLRDLQTYLNQRMQQWRDHQRAIEALLGVGSPSKWMMDLGKSMRQGLDIGFQGPSIATDLQSAVTNFGRSMNNLSLPMATGGGGSSTSNTTHNHNLSVTANYTKPQSERSLRDDLRLNQAMMRMRGSW